MVKRQLLGCLLTALILLAMGCGKAEYTLSPYEEADFTAPAGVTLSVEAIRNSGGGRSCGGTFTLRNDGEQAVCYGDRNLLERKDEDDGSWYSVVSYTERTMTEPDYTLSPGETVTYGTSWKQLKDGRYRYVMPVRLEGSAPDGEALYLLWTEFSAQGS